jgi:excisionase family DNA binding protein
LEARKITLRREGMTTAVLNSKEAAAYMAVSVEVLRNLVRAGDIPHMRIGRQLRFRLVDLDQFLEDQTSRNYKPIRTASGE